MTETPSLAKPEPKRDVVAFHGCCDDLNDAVRDGFTGALVPPRDARALADALRKYLDDPALRAEHGANARRRIVAEFDRNAVCAALAAEYQRLIRRACAGRGGGGTARRTEGAPR